MKIAIFGATGKSGIQVLQQALEHGHQVTVMVRDPQRLPTLSSAILIIKCDITNMEAITSTIQGQDAVICTLGARELYKNSGIRTQGTQAIIQAMKTTGVKRLIIMSLGIGDSWHHIPLFTKAPFKLFMPAARQDHEALTISN